MQTYMYDTSSLDDDHVHLKTMMRPGGVLKYDLGRDVPPRLESRPIFIPNFAGK